MNKRKIIAAAALCTSVVFAACATYDAKDEATESTGQESSFKKFKGDQLKEECEKADPKWNETKGTCTAGKKTDKAQLKQFLPFACCADSPLCANAKFDKDGACRNNGKFAPNSCCSAQCGGAKLDQNGLCRKGNGQFAFATCCLDECLVFTPPKQGEVLCTKETCGGAGDENETCFCDEQCVEFGDCCPNADLVCPLGRGTTAGTCEKADCGGPAEDRADNPDTCFCDEQCVEFGDCCENKVQVCGGRTPRGPRARNPKRDLNGACEENECGKQDTTSNCFCDAACVEFGDCCPKAQEVCAEIGTDPRARNARADLSKDQCEAADCGKAADPRNPASCFCDSVCLEFGDCCANVAEACPAQKPRDPGRGGPRAAGSCANKCGGQGTGECFCDEACTEIGDCCADKVDQCGGNGLLPDRPVVPAGLCTKTSCGKAGTGGSCFCDDACAEFGDCCANKASKCGGPGLDQEVIDCAPGECAGAVLDKEQVCRIKGKFAKATCCATPDKCTGATVQGGVCTATDKTTAVPLACCTKTCQSARLVRSRGKDVCRTPKGDDKPDACCADDRLARDRAVPKGRTDAALKKRADEAKRRRDARGAQGNRGRGKR